MRIWPVLSASTLEALPLGDLAEAVGGYRVDSHNAVVPIEDRQQMLKMVCTEFVAHVESASDVPGRRRPVIPPGFR